MTIFKHILLDSKLHKILKVLAVKRGTSIAALVKLAVYDWLNKNKLKS